MGPGAQTPEELETLFEDAFVVRDRAALAQLFVDGAVLDAERAAPAARGTEQIGRLAAAMWDRDYAYVAEPRCVLQARDTALVVGGRGINVVRRGEDGGWLYVISLLDMNNATKGDR